MKKLTKNLLSIMLACLLFVGGIQFSTKTKTEANASGIEEEEYVLKREIDISEDFKDDKIIVTLKKEYSSVNQKLYAEDFTYGELVDLKENEKQMNKQGEIYITRIKDLTYMSNPEKIINKEEFNQIFEIGISPASKENVLCAISCVEKLEIVLVAEPEFNYEEESNAVVRDTAYFSQWGLGGINGIDIEGLWDFSMGNTTPKIKIGILEQNGAQLDHPDLEISMGSFSGEEGNGGHGTHVAGIIGAITNDIGIAGIAQVEVVVMSGSLSETLAWAIDNDIRVVNASFSYSIGGVNTPANNADINAINNYGENGGILVCSAGNNGTNNDQNNHYPSNYANSQLYPQINNVIAVGAYDSDGQPSDFSNFGENSVSIFAPGRDILSTFPQDYCDENCDDDSNDHYSRGYHYMTGTSMAAPHVTGVLALLLAIDEDLTVSELIQSVLQGADKSYIEGVDVYGELCQSGGRLSASGAARYLFNNYGDSVNLNGTDVTFEKTIDSSETIYNQKAIMLKLNPQTISWHRITITSTNALSVTVMNSSLNVITIADTLVSQDKKSVIISETLPINEVRYLEIKFESATASGAVNIDIHFHNYTHSYQRYTLAQHKSLCACGAYILSSHAVSITATGRYKPCLACGELIDTGAGGGIGGVIHPGSINQLVTVNGSYVLPNGVIVLVDEDIEAYFAGTLKFYKKDELPENI